MASAADKNCTFLISTERSGSVQQEDICKDLESIEIPNKIRLVLFNAIYVSDSCFSFLTYDLDTFQIIHIQSTEECYYCIAGRREYASCSNDSDQVKIIMQI